MIHEYIFKDRNALAAALASSVADSLRGSLTNAEALDTKARALLVVSGGSTPRPFFAELCKIDLPWNRVTVTLADERWVNLEHEDSNERMVRKLLIQEQAAAADFLPLKTSAETPEQACGDVASRLKTWLPFDVVVLGMGGDGHTASLFPHESHLEAALAGDSLCAPSYPETAAQARLSLTPAALLNSRRLILHITGDDKRAVYERARGQGAVDELPIRSVLHQDKTDVDVYWSP